VAGAPETELDFSVDARGGGRGLTTAEGSLDLTAELPGARVVARGRPGPDSPTSRLSLGGWQDASGFLGFGSRRHVAVCTALGSP
jgi:hypothetical protein